MRGAAEGGQGRIVLGVMRQDPIPRREAPATGVSGRVVAAAFGVVAPFDHGRVMISASILSD